MGKGLLPIGCFPDSSPGSHAVFVRVLASMVISLSAGVSIIVPMVVMALNPSLPKSLVVVGVAVTVFGLVLTAMARLKTREIFVATATYTAILTVFVGLSRSGVSF
jgi:hypothetical protein